MAGLPVDPERLRREFPQLTDEDIDSYVEVTTRVLGDPKNRGRAMAGLLDRARSAREKRSNGQALAEEEALALRYLVAVEKMQ
jgi:hypothetical protein